MYDVIQCCVAMVAIFAFLATEAMCALMVHLHTTMVAAVGVERVEPKCKPTATLIMLLSILRLREVIGRAFNQGPNSSVKAAKRRALDGVSWPFSSRAFAVASTLQESQAF